MWSQYLEPVEPLKKGRRTVLAPKSLNAGKYSKCDDASALRAAIKDTIGGEVLGIDIFWDTAHTRDCSGLMRRDFVRAGVLSLGGLALPQLLQANEAARRAGKAYVRDRSIVLLFLGGGASHIETFNPNLDAPAPYASVTGEVKSAVAGLSLGGTFPQLAAHAKKLAVVRSFSHTNGNHPKAIRTTLSPDGSGFRVSGEKRWTTLGPDGGLFVVVARESGSPDERPSLKAVLQRSGAPVSHTRPTLATEIRPMPIQNSCCANGSPPSISDSAMPPSGMKMPKM